MRIGFDAKRAFSNFTGLGNYSRDTIRILEKFYPKNQYYLFTPNSKLNKRVNFINKKENMSLNARKLFILHFHSHALLVQKPQKDIWKLDHFPHSILDAIEQSWCNPVHLSHRVPPVFHR